MRFGFCLPSEGHLARPEALTALAQHAEELGFYAISFSDHIVFPERMEAVYPYSATGKVTFPPDCLELLSTLSFLAAKTRRVRLMTSIMVLPHRNPVLAAKMLATIDVLSGGRLIVGAGAGWLEDEFKALAIPPFRERGKVSAEYIEIFRNLWSTETSTFRGEFASYSSVKLFPKPVQVPRIPIWVGGESRGAMLRASRLGDGWYPTVNNPSNDLGRMANLQSAVGEFRTMVEAVGRKPEEVVLALADVKVRRVSSGDSDSLFVGDNEKIRHDVKALEALGISYIGVNIRGPTLEATLNNLDDFAEQIMAGATKAG